MDMNFLDFGMDSESDEEGTKMECMDSDEEDEIEAAALLKMMTTKIPMPHSKTKKERDVEDFQAEMEMELNRRALAVEAEGGVEHQKSLSRSSSTSSLNASASASGSIPMLTDKKSSQPTSSKSSMKQKADKSKKDEESTEKSVRFADEKTTPRSERVARNKVKEMYDEIYFDSDEDEEDPEIKAKRKSDRQFLSNDELFYDPGADDKDQNWIDNQRNAYFSPSQSQEGSGTSKSAKLKEAGVKRMPNSDAVLNCPACFTVLCLDCQQHEFYEGQYRAMFVRNCVTNKTETRCVPSKSERYKGRKRKADGEMPGTTGSASTSQTDSSDIFNPVNCKICNTEVAVIDCDEVYHFFNILSSHS